MTWWVVRATQDEVVERLCAAGLTASVSLPSRTGLVSVRFNDLDEVPALLPDRDQFEVAGTEDEYVISGWTTEGASVHWSSADPDPVAIGRPVAFFSSFGPAREDLLGALEEAKTSPGLVYLALLPRLGLAMPEGFARTIVAYDGDPEVARRAGHLFGPCTLIRGDAGWTYLKFPPMALTKAIGAVAALSRAGGAASMPFLIGDLNAGWFARFQPVHHEHFVVGATWRKVGTDGLQARPYDADRTEFFATEGRPADVVDSLLAEADAGRMPLGDFLARFGLPTFAARLLGPLADEVGDRAEHLAKMSVEEVRGARSSAALYAATAPMHIVAAGFLWAFGAFLLFMSALSVRVGRFPVGAISLALSCLFWLAGSALWRWRGRIVPFRKQAPPLGGAPARSAS